MVSLNSRKNGRQVSMEDTTCSVIKIKVKKTKKIPQQKCLMFPAQASFTTKSEFSTVLQAHAQAEGLCQRALFYMTAIICQVWATNLMLCFVHWLVKAVTFLIDRLVGSSHLSNPYRNRSLSRGAEQPDPRASDRKR